MHIEEHIDPATEELLNLRIKELRAHLYKEGLGIRPGLVAYLSSKRWKHLSGLAKRRDKHECRVPGCGKRTTLRVHHIRYPVELGQEPLVWLVTLCNSHHMRIHKNYPNRSVEEATWVVLGYEIDIDSAVEGDTPPSPREESDGEEG